LHQFQLKKKIASDAKTKTYTAIDSKLGRKVNLVLLRNNLAEKENREFLLLARSLGILNHPGILPVYDMGVIGGSFYYCYRPPPDDNLTTKLIKNKNKEWIFKNSRSFRLQVLENLAGTVAYAHKQGISIGKLDFNSIVIGDHGEIIISDWTKSRWIKSLAGNERNTVFNEWVQEDLQQLAEVGLRLYLLNEAPSDLSLSQWGHASRNIPADLMIALDRAYLGRPNEYKSVKDFRVDIDNHAKGKPSENFKGDFLTTAIGFYRQHNQIGRYYIALCLSCFAILFYYTFQISGISIDNNKDEIAITRMNRDLENIKDEIATITNKNTELKLDKDGLKEEIEWNKGLIKKTKNEIKVSEINHKKLKKSLTTFQGNLNLIQNNIDREEELLSENIETKLNKIRRSITSKKDQIEKFSKHKNYRINTHFLSKQLNDEYRINLSKLIKNKGWFSDYLFKEENENPKKDDKELLSSAPSKITVNSKGNMVAWVSQNKIYIYDFNAKPRLQKYSTKNESINTIKFSADPNILHAVSDDHLLMYRYKANDEKLNVKLQINNDRYKNLIAYTPHNSMAFLEGPTLYFLEFERIQEDEDVSWNQRTFSRTLREGARLIALPTGKHILIYDENIFLLPRMERIEHFGPKINNIRLSDHFYSISGNTLTSYKPNYNDELGNKIESIQSVTIEKPVDSVLLNSEKNTCLVHFEDQSSKFWAFNEFKGLEETEIQGKPMLFYRGKILLLNNKSLSVHNLGTHEDEPQIDYRSVFNTKSKPTTLLILEDEIVIDKDSLKNEFELVDIEQPDPDNPIAFILNGPHRVELWDLKEKIRLDVIGYSEQRLSMIAYSKKHRKVFAKGKNGIEYW
jgi:hypothetical protein